MTITEGWGLCNETENLHQYFVDCNLAAKALAEETAAVMA